MTTRTISFWIPIRTVSGANSREHWGAKARRVKKERGATFGHGFSALHGVSHADVDAVSFVRHSPLRLDGDNLTSALKAVRDEVAAILQTDDGPDVPIRWLYSEVVTATGYAVEVVVTLKDSSS